MESRGLVKALALWETVEFSKWETGQTLFYWVSNGAEGRCWANYLSYFHIVFHHSYWNNIF